MSLKRDENLNIIEVYGPWNEIYTRQDKFSDESDEDILDLKYGTRYFDEVYSLPIEINFDFKINDEACEMIPVFSETMANWGSGNEDALSMYASSHRSDFTFRTELFRKFPKCAYKNTFEFEVG